jgi:serine/threonine protein kinase
MVFGYLFNSTNNNVTIMPQTSQLSEKDDVIQAQIMKDFGLRKAILKYFDNKLFKLHETYTSCIYVDASKSHILKCFYEDTVICKTLFGVECEAYQCLKYVKNTGELLYKSTKESKALILRYIGQDGLDITNSHGPFMFDTWVCMVRDTVSTLRIIHNHKLIHGDVKLENLAFDGNSWHFIDFGFSCIDFKHGISGTFPFILPYIGGVAQKQQWPTLALTKQAADIYALSLSLLTAVGVLPHDICDRCKYEEKSCEQLQHQGKRKGTRIDIELISTIHQDPTCLLANYKSYGVLAKPLTELLCEIVLSQVDVTRKYLIWQEYKAEYYGGNKVKTIVHHTKIEYAWRELIKLSKILL